jgi:hypothetical protein
MTLKDNGDGTFGVIPTTWFQNDVWTCCRGCGQRVTGDSIHTCSPQLKPLSDEEIDKVIDSFTNKYFNYHDFARAIEERHGIK